MFFSCAVLLQGWRQCDVLVLHSDWQRHDLHERPVF